MIFRTSERHKNKQSRISTTHFKQLTRMWPYTNYNTCNKGWRMNYFKNFYIQQFQRQGSLTDEQSVDEIKSFICT
jgi:hypothetical protein